MDLAGLHKVKYPFKGLDFDDLDEIRVGRQSVGIVWAKRGDHLHAGVDIGDGTVVNFAHAPDSDDDAVIGRVGLGDFADGREVSYGNLADDAKHLHPSLTIALAFAHLGVGRGRYDALKCGCEHLALFCVTGFWQRLQEARTTEDWTWQAVPAATSSGDSHEPISPPLYGGEIWQGKGGPKEWWTGKHGHRHFRAQVVVWDEPPEALERPSPLRDGPWVRAVPWRVSAAQIRRRDDLVPIGLGQIQGWLEGHWEEFKDKGTHTVGPWRDFPDTPTGQASAGTRVKEHLLDPLGEVWLRFENGQLHQYFYEPPRNWYESDSADLLGIPVLCWSPLIRTEWRHSIQAGWPVDEYRPPTDLEG